MRTLFSRKISLKKVFSCVFKLVSKVMCEGCVRFGVRNRQVFSVRCDLLFTGLQIRNKVFAFNSRQLDFFLQKKKK